ncbi:electron transfer flavoprotein alpha subunit [Nitrobacteraceae bacterium AZCC 2161]
MTTLLIAEHEHEVLKDSTNKALTAATALGAEVHILVAGGGEGTKAAAAAAAKLAGVTKVLLAENAAYQPVEKSRFQPNGSGLIVTANAAN